MTSQTLADIIVTDKEVSGYMEQRDNSEHLKIKSPNDYLEEIQQCKINFINLHFSSIMDTIIL